MPSREFVVSEVELEISMLIIWFVYRSKTSVKRPENRKAFFSFSEPEVSEKRGVVQVLFSDDNYAFIN